MLSGVKLLHKSDAEIADSIQGTGHVLPLLQMTGHGGTESRRTTNKKLNKLCWPSRKRSPKRLIGFVKPKKVEGHEEISGASCLTCLPVLNLSQRHWIGLHHLHRHHHRL